jgi:hypothetical protein
MDAMHSDVRAFFGLLLLLGAGCSSGSDAPATPATGGCPIVGGTWKVTAHCDPSLIGQSAVVTQTDCSLTFAAPFNGFTGTVTSDDKISVSGPQSCTGTASASSISMSCTPGTCTVTLSR